MADANNWVPRREVARRRATFGFSGSDGEEGGKPAGEGKVARTSASRFSIGNPARGNIDLGGFVKPRINPDYDPNAPIEQRTMPYREAGFWRRLIGDTANEANAEFSAQQQALQVAMREAEFRNELAQKLEQMAHNNALERQRYGTEIEGQTRLVLGDREHQQALERGRVTNDLGRQSTLFEQGARTGFPGMGTLAQFPDDPMQNQALSSYLAEQAERNRSLEDRQAALTERQVNADIMRPRVSGQTFSTADGGLNAFSGGGVDLLTGKTQPYESFPLVVGQGDTSKVWNPPGNVPAPVPFPENPSGVPGQTGEVRQPSSQTRVDGLDVVSTNQAPDTNILQRILNPERADPASFVRRSPMPEDFETVVPRGTGLRPRRFGFNQGY